MSDLDLQGELSFLREKVQELEKEVARLTTLRNQDIENLMGSQSRLCRASLHVQALAEIFDSHPAIKTGADFPKVESA